jgi:hypothetical protein
MKPFIPGVDFVRYAGHILDHNEVTAVVNSLSGECITMGRYTIRGIFLREIF